MSLSYIVTAKQYGNTVQFEVFADNVKDALALAKKQANDIFDLKDGQEVPTVSIRLNKDQGEK